MGMASFLVAGAVLSVSNSAGEYVVIGSINSTATAATDCCRCCGWPECLCGCLRALTADTRFSSAALRLNEHTPPPFGWYRDFERQCHAMRAAARELVPAVQRIWRRLRGHDAGQVRRQKRRRFVQQLSEAA